MDLVGILSIIAIVIAAIGVIVQILDYTKKKKDGSPKSGKKKPSVNKVPAHEILPEDLESFSKDLINIDPARRNTLDRLSDMESEPDGRIHKELRKKMLRVMKDQTQPVTRRSGAGNALALLGDPRFRSDAWFLPGEDLLGFVEIPAGPFQMGRDASAAQSNDSRAGPQHEVHLETFFIGRFPVTVMQYRVFLAEIGAFKPDEIPQGFDHHPVVSVSWYDAMHYCKWLTKQLRTWPDTPKPLAELLRSSRDDKTWVVTLPSEAEWEKSARGKFDARAYPWGPVVDPNKANYRESGLNATSTVGCFEGGCSPYIIHDLSGNVLEWTRSNWGSDVEVLKFKYPYDPLDGREDTQAPETMFRIMRGGSFNSPAADILCSCRIADLPNARYDHVGFRLVITQLPL